MIKFENVSFKYINENIIENLDLEISEGSIISVIGKNGTGKSTFLNLISGIIKPSKGNVLIDDLNTKSKKDFIKLRKKIGMVFQNPDNQVLFPKVYEDMEFALKNLKLEDRNRKIDNALKIVNMLEFKDKSTYELSLGQKQRINIASVLAIEPKYIILDEPTTMIDSSEKVNIYNSLKQLKDKGYTIIFATNNINEILLSDKIFVLENRGIKHIINKKELIESNNVKILEECNIELPDIIKILIKLKESNVSLNIKEWSSDEMIEIIVKMCIKK